MISRMIARTDSKRDSAGGQDAPGGENSSTILLMFRISSFYTASVTSLFEGGGYDRPAFQEPHFGGRVPLGCMAGVPCLYSNSQGAVLCGHLLNGSKSEISSHLEHRTVVTRCKSIDSTSLALAEHRPFGMFPSETGKACGIFGTSSEGAEDKRGGGRRTSGPLPSILCSRCA